jgi:hypothetical protein
MKTMLKYELTAKEVDDLEEDIINWVMKYEEYVYNNASTPVLMLIIDTTISIVRIDCQPAS